MQQIEKDDTIICTEICKKDACEIISVHKMPRYTPIVCKTNIEFLFNGN